MLSGGPSSTSSSSPSTLSLEEGEGSLIQGFPFRSRALMVSLFSHLRARRRRIPTMVHEARRAKKELEPLPRTVKQMKKGRKACNSLFY